MGKVNSFMDQMARNVGYLDYQDYLAAPHWQAFSKQVRKKACFCCNRSCLKLCVHHLTYDRLGDELPDDVETVCEECHYEIHKLHKARKASLWNAHMVYKEKILAEKPREVTRQEKRRSTKRKIGREKCKLIMRDRITVTDLMEQSGSYVIARYKTGKMYKVVFTFIDAPEELMDRPPQP